jgi:hypothetical protein
MVIVMLGEEDGGLPGNIRSNKSAKGQFLSHLKAETTMKKRSIRSAALRTLDMNRGEGNKQLHRQRRRGT